MVEQIDALSRVAGDFSRFAQMSAAHETVLDLNEVARSSVALLAGEPNADIVLQASAPLMVRADREHLLRVFNNLLKNALQAIPDDREGRIEVVLRSKRRAAPWSRCATMAPASPRMTHREHLRAQLHHEEQRNGAGTGHGETHGGASARQRPVRNARWPGTTFFVSLAIAH